MLRPPMPDAIRSHLPCGLELRGRVGFAPLTNTQSHLDGTLSDEEARWLLARAEGGFGWVSTCATYVSEEGKAWEGQLGLGCEAHVPGLRELAAATRRLDSHLLVQLHHGGPRATLAPQAKLGTATIEAENIVGATEADLARVRQDFVDAACRAEAAGCAGVEIHGANGYVFTHFLSPVENRRRDGYGGSLAGRARFLRETLREVRGAVSPDFAVGVRISPIDIYGARGILLMESEQVARWLCEDGADFIHLSMSDLRLRPPEAPDGPPVCRVIRDAMDPSVPLLAAGGIWTREDLEVAFALGVDVGVVGKAAIIHPNWPALALERANWTPTKPPFPLADLRAAAASPRMLAYLNKFPGLIEGGAPPRQA